MIARTFLSIAVAVFFCNIAAAEPMMAPSNSEAFASPFIVEAEYKDYWEAEYKPGPNQTTVFAGYKRSNKFDYFHPPAAEFKITQVFKNADKAHADMIASGKTIHVPYDFHDGSACLAERGWHFSESLLPKKSSKLILFLSRSAGAPKDLFVTYRGDFGRWPATDENLAKVQKGLAAK